MLFKLLYYSGKREHYQSIFVYCCLFLYASTLLKPVLPSIVDLMDHGFCYSEHMAKVHKHLGADHVHKEYLSILNNDKGDNNKYILEEAFGDTHLIVNSLVILGITPCSYSPFKCHIVALSRGYCLYDYPPPRM